MATGLDILTPDVLRSAINMVEPPPNLKLTGGESPYFGRRTYPVDKIKWDIVYPVTGLMQATQRDADIPLSRIPRYAQMEVNVGVLRRKFHLTESEVNEIRQAGTRDAPQGMTKAGQLTNGISNALDNSEEFYGWESLKGAVNLKHANGTTEAVSYKMPPFLTETLTGQAKWTDTANSDPADDIGRWLEILERNGITIREIVFSSTVRRLLINNAKIRTLLAGTPGERLLAQGQLPQNQIADVPYDVMKGRFLATANLRAAYTSGTTLKVDDALEISDLANGDVIRVGPSTDATDNMQTEEATVTSISGRDITMSAALTYDYATEDPIFWSRPFIGKYDVFLLPEGDGQDWADIAISTATDGYTRGQNGRYAYTEWLPGTPRIYEVMGGENFLPVIWRQGRHFHAIVG